MGARDANEEKLLGQAYMTSAMNWQGSVVLNMVLIILVCMLCLGLPFPLQLRLRHEEFLRGRVHWAFSPHQQAGSLAEIGQKELVHALQSIAPHEYLR